MFKDLQKLEAISWYCTCHTDCLQSREPSLAEIQYYEDLCTKLEAAGKQLGRAYCVLILGIGLDTQHHMACGG